MKMNITKKIFLSTLMLLVFTVASAQNEVPLDVISALSGGDVAKLAPFLNSNVELVIAKTNDVFSRQQATGIIADFFKKNKVSSFNVLHNGMRESASFLIGTLGTNNGNFRVYLLMRKSGNQSLIQQLRIESSNE
jgi:hypothetical protein